MQSSSEIITTTNSSWLPWGRVAMPLISPLMPVLQPHSINVVKISQLVFCAILLTNKQTNANENIISLV